MAAKARMQGSVLLQAMQAFKDAVAGAALDDFLVWQMRVGASVGVPSDTSAMKEVGTNPYSRTKSTTLQCVQQ